jgi:tripartite-type tricarboxylate transporter receptor subunit TctC
MATQIRCLIALVIGLALPGNTAKATSHEFYGGKAIRIVVGYAPGGGYDLYARVIARHMGKHIPGNPTFIVENMPGAGSLVSANHLYKLAKADGLVIGHFNGSLFQLKAMGQKEIEFDSTQFEYVGSVAKVEIACGFSKASGMDNVEKWLAAKAAPRMGATAPGTGGLAQWLKLALAANQGLYNGFLAAGLLWSLLAPPALHVPLATFFAGCVIVAGIFGAVTVSRRILIVQALPAALALAAVWANR